MGGGGDGGSPLLRSLWARPRRFDQSAFHQHAGRTFCARRLDTDAAARKELVLVGGSHAVAQVRRAGAGALAGTAAVEKGYPRALSQPCLFRRRRVRH